jgi:hypothetical protein
MFPAIRESHMSLYSLLFLAVVGLILYLVLRYLEDNKYVEFLDTKERINNKNIKRGVKNGKRKQRSRKARRVRIRR